MDQFGKRFGRRAGLISGFAVLALLAPAPAMANCIPPYQTLFACNIENTKARAEFCRIADPAKYPDKKEAYYTYVNGVGPAELYFEADSYYFSTKDTEPDHPSWLTMGMGLVRGKWVYAFSISEGKDDSNWVGNGEVRVYSSIDAFTNNTKNTEDVRLVCEPSSLIADTPNIRP